MELVETVERRHDVRHREFKHAKILAVRDHPDTICKIRNLSVNGAELGVGFDQHFPEKFDLHIRADQKTFRCRQVWRDGAKIGVGFIGNVV